ncbi:hypothetical protein AWC24_03540 [Mycolicibacter senuensis]|nr:hypothetical protein AWC24_03540 [Mycolicibacter senuensis]
MTGDAVGGGPVQRAQFPAHLRRQLLGLDPGRKRRIVVARNRFRSGGTWRPCASVVVTPRLAATVPIRSGAAGRAPLVTAGCAPLVTGSPSLLRTALVTSGASARLTTSATCSVVDHGNLSP